MARRGKGVDRRRTVAAPARRARLFRADSIHRRAGMHGQRGELPMLCPSRWRNAIPIVGLVVLGSAGPSHGQPAPGAVIIDPIFVTATRSPQLLTDLIADVTYIGPDEIARAGAQSIAELLQRQPGVQIV